MSIEKTSSLCKFALFMKRGIIIFFSVILCFGFISCEKEYTCVCTKISNNQKEPQEKVKTTKLGKKGFEQSCKAKSEQGNDLTDCHIE